MRLCSARGRRRRKRQLLPWWREAQGKVYGRTRVFPGGGWKITKFRSPPRKTGRAVVAVAESKQTKEQSKTQESARQKCVKKHTEECARDNNKNRSTRKRGAGNVTTHTQKIEGKKKARSDASVTFFSTPGRSVGISLRLFFYIYIWTHIHIQFFFNGTPFLRLVYMFFFFFFNNIKRSFNFLPPVGRGRERKGLKKIHQKDGLHRQSHQKRDVSAFVPSSSSGKRREKEKEIQ